MNLRSGKVRWAAVAIAVVAVIVLVMRPAAVGVDAGVVARGPLEELVSAEGRTRVHDRYVVASPVTGRLVRIDLREGDAVTVGQVVARIEATPLDPRQQEEARARLDAALSLEREAKAVVLGVSATCAQARRDRERAERLAASGEVSRQELERARNTEVTCGQDLEAAKFRAGAAADEVAAARATLAERSSKGAPAEAKAPVASRVLRVLEKSERVVTAGTPLVELSDPGGLEAIADVLSTDAVRIRPGAEVRIDGWGGDRTIAGRVRVVEPGAFTKVSALGVEEQRVWVVIDVDDPPVELGDGYRIEANIITWASADVLKVPTSAIFRKGDSWAVFAVDGGRAREREVAIGHRSELEAEVTKGLDAGARVVLHPTASVSDGVRIEVRK